MKRTIFFIFGIAMVLCVHATNNLKITDTFTDGHFPLVDKMQAASIYIDKQDYKVVEIAASMLADDIKRVTGNKANLMKVKSRKELPSTPLVIAGTLGKSSLIDWLVAQKVISVDDIEGKWESFISTRSVLHSHKRFFGRMEMECIAGLCIKKYPNSGIS